MSKYLYCFEGPTGFKCCTAHHKCATNNQYYQAPICASKISPFIEHHAVITTLHPGLIFNDVAGATAIAIIYLIAIVITFV
jgi:hypothetical protein